MKPHSIGLDEITPENIVTIDLDGNVVDGRLAAIAKSSSILKSSAREQTSTCVIHTHPPYAIALSASGRPLRAYSQPGALFHNAVGTYADTMKLIRHAQMGAGVARALGGQRRDADEPRRRGGRRKHRGSRHQHDHARKCGHDSDDCRGRRYACTPNCRRI